MLFNSPLSDQKADQLIDSLTLSPSFRVLDVGCGSGEFLIRTVEQKQVRGTGVDLDSNQLSMARETAFHRVPPHTCEFVEADAKTLTFENHSFDAAICIGSTHAFGDGDTAYPNAIRELSRLVKPGGCLLLGEGYWKQPPVSEYLDLIGDPVGIYHDHATNVSFATNQGLILLTAYVSNDDEWDKFEWTHQRRIEQQHAASPTDPSLTQRLEQRRAWMRGYLHWGRATMGFGFYTFRTPNK